MFVVTQICYSLLTIWWCDNDKNYNDDGDIIKKKSHDIRLFFLSLDGIIMKGWSKWIPLCVCECACV